MGNARAMLRHPTVLIQLRRRVEGRSATMEPVIPRTINVTDMTDPVSLLVLVLMRGSRPTRLGISNGLDG